MVNESAKVSYRRDLIAYSIVGVARTILFCHNEEIEVCQENWDKLSKLFNKLDENSERLKKLIDEEPNG